VDVTSTQDITSAKRERRARNVKATTIRWDLNMVNTPAPVSSGDGSEESNDGRLRTPAVKQTPTAYILARSIATNKRH
jgi:hypothetical protein